MLSKLKSITFAAFLTALTSEMCLEVQIMTSEGTIYRWIGYDDWNVYILKKCDSPKWFSIMDKLKNSTLELEDLDGTDLGKLMQSLDPVMDEDEGENADCSLLLQELLEVSTKIQDTFYCYYDKYDRDLNFFSSREDLKVALREAYSIVDTRWEDMDTSELQGWWEWYEDEGEEWKMSQHA